MNRTATRWRGKLPIPEHAHPLVQLLIKEANRQKTTLREIAERAGVSPKTISDWRYRGSPTITNLVAAFNALGKTLVVRDDNRERAPKRHTAEPLVIDIPARQVQA